MRRLGIFGGSFDPVHLGHLNLAIEMKEKHQLDQVCFYPARVNPNKFVKESSEKGFSSAEHRMQMVRLALEEIPGLTFSTLEFSRAGPSYTIDTLRILAENQKSAQQFFLIIGEDAATNLHQWREPEEIVKKARLLIGARSLLDPEVIQNRFQGSPSLLAAIKEGYTKTRILEISATEIRKRLAVGLYCGHLLPAKVMDYIRINELYL